MALRAALPPALVLLLAAVPSARAAGDPTMPLSQVRPGMHCTARTVLRGTTISTFTVDVIDVVDGDVTEGDRILVRVSGAAIADTGVAEGFSGSPVYCPDAQGTQRVIGAISETIGQYGNTEALVTPIAQILGEPVVPPVAGATFRPALLRAARPLASALTFAGLPPRLGAVLQAAGAKLGRLLIPAPAGAATRFAPPPLVPGASVSAGYSSGALAVGGIGTVTYRDGASLWAFGHELDGVGQRSLLLQDAYVYSVVGNPVGGDLASYKLAAPGHDLGTITDDTPNAIVGRVGARPPITALIVDATDDDTGQSQSMRVSVADETDAGLPDGSSPLALVGPLAVAAGATNIYDGAPYLESGRMCLRFRVAERRGPFGFCNRYVLPGSIMNASGPPLANSAASDASAAFSLLDAVNFARLHVTGVRATLQATRGLALGYLVSATAPQRARAGARITLRLGVRRYRGALVSRRVRVRVPRALHSGVQLISVLGSAPDDASGTDDLGSILVDVLGGGGSSSGGAGDSTGSPGPLSLPELVDQVRALHRDDGVSVAFPGLGGHAGRAGRQALLDPTMRIAGRATAFVRVVARPRHHKRR